MESNAGCPRNAAYGCKQKNLRINMNLAPVLDPPKDDRGKNGIISVSKHFLGYDSWTNNDLQISVSESPKENILENVRFFKTFAKDIPVTMMSSVQFTHISDRPLSCSQTTFGEHRSALGPAKISSDLSQRSSMPATTLS